MDKIKLVGTFIKHIYKSENSKFSVILFLPYKNKSDIEMYQKIIKNKYLSIVNNNHEIEIKKEYEIIITRQEHSKYDNSFILNEIAEIVVDKKEVAISFLSSKKFKGITAVDAKKIIEKYGDDFIWNYEKYSESAKSIISKAKLETIIYTLKQENDFAKIYFDFANNGLNIKLLYQLIEDMDIKKLLSIINDNAYKLLKENIELNFYDIDNIAKIFNKEESSSSRNKNFINWALINLSNNSGSTIIDLKFLFNERIKNDLDISKEEYLKNIKELIDEKEIIFIDKNNISSSYFYEKEKEICEKINKLITTKKIFDEKDEEKYIISKKIDEKQKKAIIYSLANSISIISGPPGTGKTTLVNEICFNLKENNQSFAILAPTGKAAYQLSKKTEMNAKTIHSFLEMSKDGKYFNVNSKKPSKETIIIIDEFSMVNINLFHSLLTSLPKLEKLILIGDMNQLPSIGAGYLLNDFIESKRIKTFFLNKNYRQKTGSKIIDNAQLINQAQEPIFNENDFQMITLKDNEINDFLFKNNVCKTFLKSGWNNHQILSPSYLGSAGIDSINDFIQNHYAQKEKRSGFQINKKMFYQNDKIIQISNENELGVFNGEIGLIKDFEMIDDDVKKIIIEFEGKKIIEYTKLLFTKSINLAYAISVHKFQGSECDNIILIMSEAHHFVQSKKLFYTAITRAKNKLLILGTTKAIKNSIDKDEDSQRNCNIKFLLSI
ncbi:MAG: SF1B family DNA helicase RecD2 [Metamycoplasmataceae bacterium]